MPAEGDTAMEMRGKTAGMPGRAFLDEKQMMLICSGAAFILFLNSLLKYFFDTPVLRIVTYAVLGLAAAAGLIYLGRNKMKIGKDIWLLIAFLVWYLVVCVYMTVDQKQDMTRYNMEPMIDCAACLLMLYPLGVALGRGDRVPGTVRVIGHLMVLSWTAFLGVILMHVFQGKYIVTPNNGYLGIYSGALIMNCNRNTVGMWGVVFYPCCLYMVLAGKKPGMRILYGIAMVIQYFALVLSASRTAIYADVIATVMMTGIAVFRKLRGKTLHRVLLAGVIGAAAGAAFYLLRGAVFGLYNAAIGQLNPAELPETVTAVINARDMAPDSRLSGRDKVWEATFKAITSSVPHTVLGVTPAAAVSAIYQASDNTLNMYAHNEFLEITLSLGVIGMGIFGAWLVLMGKDLWTLLHRKDGWKALCIGSIAVALLAANMMESTLLFYSFISGYAFFLACGYAHGAAERKATEEEHPAQEM